jgi:hypothetical protein
LLSQRRVNLCRSVEVRGCFFRLFDGKLLILGKNGDFYDADEVRLSAKL